MRGELLRRRLLALPIAWAGRRSFSRAVSQIEIYFSIVQRKLLTPNDFASKAEVADRLRQFESHFPTIAKPFEWTFTRDDLANLLKKLDLPSLADAA